MPSVTHNLFSLSLSLRHVARGALGRSSKFVFAPPPSKKTKSLAPPKTVVIFSTCLLSLLIPCLTTDHLASHKEIFDMRSIKGLTRPDKLDVEILRKLR